MGDAGLGSGGVEEEAPRAGVLLWGTLGLVCAVCGMVALTTLAAFPALVLMPFALGDLGGGMGMAVLVSGMVCKVHWDAVVRKDQAAADLIVFFAWCIAAVGIYLTGAFWWERGGGLLSDSPEQLMFALGSACLAGHGLIYRRWSKALERYGKRHELCPRCGYDLRGTVAAGIGRCPECGQEVERARGMANEGMTKRGGTGSTGDVGLPTTDGRSDRRHNEVR